MTHRRVSLKTWRWKHPHFCRYKRITWGEHQRHLRGHPDQAPAAVALTTSGRAAMLPEADRHGGHPTHCGVVTVSAGRPARADSSRPSALGHAAIAAPLSAGIGCGQGECQRCGRAVEAEIGLACRFQGLVDEGTGVDAMALVQSQTVSGSLCKFCWPVSTTTSGFAQSPEWVAGAFSSVIPLPKDLCE